MSFNPDGVLVMQGIQADRFSRHSLCLFAACLKCASAGFSGCVANRQPETLVI